MPGYWQVAFVAGNTFTVVSFLAAALHLTTSELAEAAYYPSYSMVSTVDWSSSLAAQMNKTMTCNCCSSSCTFLEAY